MVTVKDSVRLVIEKLPSGVWPVIGRKVIPVVVAIPQNMIGRYIADSTRAVLDLKTIKRGDRMVLPTVEGLPPYSRVLSVDSVRIKF